MFVSARIDGSVGERVEVSVLQGNWALLWFVYTVGKGAGLDIWD